VSTPARASSGVLERVHLPVRPGSEEDFERAMAATGLEVLRAADGCRDVQLRRGVESSSTYLLTVEWDAVEAHTAFTQQPAFAGLVDILKTHLGGPTDMQHFGPPLGVMEGGA
jgi:heme-degrading monooxygenase HmoA